MAKKSSNGNGDKVMLIRTYSAGVHVGVVVTRKGKEATIRDSHRIWRWRGANTLTELALRGASLTDHTRISERAPGLVTLTEVIEVIEASPEAAENLRKPRWL